jgi:hypothetical protein
VRWGSTLLFAIGCARTLHPEAPATSPAGILALARARPVPEIAAARLDLQLTAPGGLAGATGGALLVQRPAGHLAVLGLLGSPVLTITTDGSAFSVDLPRDRRHLVAPEAAAVLTEIAGPLLTPEDLVAVLLGDLPLDDAPTRRERARDDELVSIGLQGTRGRLTATLTRDGTLHELTLDAIGGPLLVGKWEPYAEVTLGDRAYLVPTRATLLFPRWDAQLDLRYKSWWLPDPVPPVFSTTAVEGQTNEDLAHFVKTLGWSALFEAVGI